MEKNNALITEEQRIQNIIDFNEDIFQKVSSQFSQNFYPFIIKDNNLQNLDIENSQEFLSNLEFYRIYECTIESTDDLFEYFVNKMQKIFTMFYSLNKEFYYGFISKEDKVNLVIGFQSEFFSDEMIKIIAGNISGTKLEKLNENFSSFKNKENYVGYLTGIPDIKLDGKIQNKDISSLIRSLNGENYIIMTLCRPLQKDEIEDKVREIINIKDICSSIAKRTVSLQKSITNGESNTYTHTEGDSIGCNVNVGGGIGAPMGGPFGFASVGASYNTNKSDSTSKSTSLNKMEGQSFSLDIQNSYAIEW